MLAGMLALLNQISQSSLITVYSGNPGDSQQRHHINTLSTVQVIPPRRRLEIPRFVFEHLTQRSVPLLSCLLKHDTFILGGGDLIRDSLKSDPAGLWLTRLQQAIYLRRKTLTLGISVGDTWKPETQELVPKVLNRVGLISVRDQLSKVKLESLGVHRPIYVTSDLALEVIPQVSFPQKEITHPVKVCIAARPIAARGENTDLSLEDIFYQNLAKIADFLVDSKKAQVIFLPFQTNQDNSEELPSYCEDYGSIQNILAHSNSPDKFIVYRRATSVEFALNIIKDCSLVIGTRLHSLILAAGLGIPLIAAEYDSKVKGFMTEIKAQNYSIPIPLFTESTVIPMIEDMLCNNSDVATSLSKNVEAYRQRMSAFKVLLQDFLLN